MKRIQEMKDGTKHNLEFRQKQVFIESKIENDISFFGTSGGQGGDPVVKDIKETIKKQAKYLKSLEQKEKMKKSLEVQKYIQTKKSM